MDLKFFFACAELFPRKSGQTILQKWSVIEGRVKNILYPSFDNLWFPLQKRIPTSTKKKVVIYVGIKVEILKCVEVVNFFIVKKQSLDSISGPLVNG